MPVGLPTEGAAPPSVFFAVLPALPVGLLKLRNIGTSTSARPKSGAWLGVAMLVGTYLYVGSPPLVQAVPWVWLVGTASDSIVFVVAVFPMVGYGSWVGVTEVV